MAEHTKDNGRERSARLNEPKKIKKVVRVLLLCIPSDLCDQEVREVNCSKMALSPGQWETNNQHKFSVWSLCRGEKQRLEMMGKADKWSTVEVSAPHWCNIAYLRFHSTTQVEHNHAAPPGTISSIINCYNSPPIIWNVSSWSSHHNEGSMFVCRDRSRVISHMNKLL